MKIKELIEELKKVDKESRIKISYSYFIGKNKEYESFKITHIIIVPRNKAIILEIS